MVLTFSVSNNDDKQIIVRYGYDNETTKQLNRLFIRHFLFPKNKCLTTLQPLH
jgi:hypothetical protein